MDSTGEKKKFCNFNEGCVYNIHVYEKLIDIIHFLTLYQLKHLISAIKIIAFLYATLPVQIIIRPINVAILIKQVFIKTGFN